MHTDIYIIYKYCICNIFSIYTQLYKFSVYRHIYITYYIHSVSVAYISTCSQRQSSYICTSFIGLLYFSFPACLKRTCSVLQSLSMLALNLLMQSSAILRWTTCQETENPVSQFAFDLFFKHTQQSFLSVTQLSLSTGIHYHHASSIFHLSRQN